MLFKPDLTTVVTGGAGFIGSTLVRALLEAGRAVAVVDDLSFGRRENLPDHPALTFHRLTVGPENAAGIADIVAEAGLVYHLASPIGVALAHSARYQVVESILESGGTVIKACRRHACPLVMVSSSEIYGRGLPRPLREDDPISLGIAPRWGYATAKAALEHYTAALHQNHGVPTWIVRPFNVAGPRQRPGSGLVIASFVANATAGRPLEIHGDGSQMRSFLHVRDAADALVRVAFNDGLIGRPVNMGSENPISILDLAEMVRRLLDVDVPVVSQPLSALMGGGFTPVPIRIPDVGLLREATGWAPSRTIEDAILDCRDALRDTVEDVEA